MMCAFRTIILLFVLAAFSGCAVKKDWVATGGSRADGTIKLSYEHLELESPQLDEQQAMRLAAQRCQFWGYNRAEAFGGTINSCQIPDGWGGCSRWRVTKEYQCIGNLEK